MGSSQHVQLAVQYVVPEQLPWQVTEPPWQVCGGLLATIVEWGLHCPMTTLNFFTSVPCWGVTIPMTRGRHTERDRPFSATAGTTDAMAKNATTVRLVILIASPPFLTPCSFLAWSDNSVPEPASEPLPFREAATARCV